MRQKLVTLFTLGLLVFGGLHVFASDNDTKTISESINIPSINIHEADMSSTVSLSIPSGMITEPGYPLLPKLSRIYILPAGSTNIEVTVEFSNSEQKIVSSPLQSAQAPISLDMRHDDINNPPTTEYSEENFYPETTYNYFVSGGMNNNEKVTYVTVMCYPVCYLASETLLSYSKHIDIQIDYKPGQLKTKSTDSYDLLIIAPDAFRSALQPLVDHKNSVGIETILKTTEEVYAEYQGVDKPEKIKYCIKEAFDEYDIKYVLLVGGLNSKFIATPRDDKNQGTQDWYVPVRYANIITQHDPGLISDLYFADLYNETWAFSSWDSNNDGIFASFKSFDPMKDTIDLVPEVAVGRLACRDIEEVNICVEKIIAYETADTSESWRKNFVLIGGDTFNDALSYIEGEIENQKAFDYVSDKGYEPVKVWASQKDTQGFAPVTDDIITAVSDGAGLMLFAGHGTPELWNTHWVGGPFNTDDRAEGIWWYNMKQFSNEDQAPITVVGGCHNSQFNVTATTFLNYWINKVYEITGIDFFKRFEGSVYTPLPECFSWYIVRQPQGGAIVSIGNTGTGYGRTGNQGDVDGDGIDDPDCIEALGGYLETLFFKAYGQKDCTYVGDAWQQAITDYLLLYPGMKDQSDAKTVEQWVLLGDPSLKIDGYD